LRIQTLFVPRGYAMNGECRPEVVQPWLKAATVEPHNIGIATKNAKHSVQSGQVHGLMFGKSY
jgi:hypothetical protein